MHYPEQWKGVRNIKKNYQNDVRSELDYIFLDASMFLERLTCLPYTMNLKVSRDE